MLRIGSRGSALALAQSEWVKHQIAGRFPGARISIRIIKTSADKDIQMSIRSGSGIGVFVKELEEALIAKEIDLAVHSMKDLPTRIPDSLQISAIPVREDARDALLARGEARNLSDLPGGSIVGTGSIRRQAQILAFRPDLQIADIRGNVDTRLNKLANREYDAIILACAGLNRLGLQDKIDARLDFSEMLPAPGQGALALETRLDDSHTSSMLGFLHHPPTAAAVFAERAFLRYLGGGCNSPIAVHAEMVGDRVRIDGLVSSADGTWVVRRSILHDLNEAEHAAAALAGRILECGGSDILRSLN